MAFPITASRGRRLWSAPRVVLLGVLALLCLVPMLWLVLAPSKTESQIDNGSPLSFGSLGGYHTAWRHLISYDGGVLYHWIANTAEYSLGAMALGVTTALLAGYALAATRIAGRRIILVATLMAMIVPTAALVLPLFMEVNAVRLTNTAVSVILPASLFPFGVYLSFIHFSTRLPREVLEAARIDGCSEAALFTRIALPLAKPLIALLSYFAFVGNWNNYFLPFVMLSDESKYNLQVGLGALISGTPALNPSVGGSQLPIHRPEVAVAGLVTTIPVVLVFLFSQRFLVKGMLDGALKS